MSIREDVQLIKSMLETLAQASIAISLKRIADHMGKRAEPENDETYQQRILGECVKHDVNAASRPVHHQDQDKQATRRQPHRGARPDSPRLHACHREG